MSSSVLQRFYTKKKEVVCLKLVTFCFGTFAMLFCTTRHVVDHEALENEGYIVIKAYTFTVFEILRAYFVSNIITLHVRATLHTESTVAEEIYGLH